MTYATSTYGGHTALDEKVNALGSHRRQVKTFPQSTGRNPSVKRRKQRKTVSRPRK